MPSTINFRSPTAADFRINNAVMPTPSTIQWELPKAWGVDGSGLERLDPYGSCTLTWNTMSYGDYTTLRDAYDAITGTASVKLPGLYGDTFAWASYLACIVDMPRIEGPQIEGQNPTNVRMKIRKINPGRVSVG